MASRGARVLGHGREGFIMGLLDDIKGKAEELKDKAVEMVQGNSDKVDDAVDKAGDFVDAVSYTHLTLPTSDLV